MFKGVKEPVSSLTHLLGAFLSIICTVFLIHFSDDLTRVVSFLIFGIALVLLYSASAAYHMMPISNKATEVLRRIDHMMIFVLIAGSYTPICLVTLRGPWGWSLLITIWLLAISGMIVKAFWINAPRILSTAIYLFMGWLIAVAFYPLAKSIPAAGIAVLVSGGVVYSAGAVIYALKRPRFNLKWFGFHELFHLFVMGGSSFHIIFMFKYVLWLD